MILLEFLKFFECILVYDNLYHFFINNFPTSLLWTLHCVTLPRLSYLIDKEVMISCAAKLVTACFLGDEKIADWVSLITDATIKL